MTITAQTSATNRATATKRAPMTSLRKTALIAGGFYVLTFIASIPPVLFLLGPVLDNPNYIVSSGADTQVLWGLFLDVITALAGIGTAVALFPVVKRQSQAAALGFVTTRVLEAAIIVIGVVSLLSVVTLRQDAAGTPGADATSLVTTGHALVAIRDWTFLLGPSLMAGLNALLLGSLMFRSGLVPRVIPVLGLIGAPLLLVSVATTMFGMNSLTSVWHGIATAPIFVWELSLGVYLVVKGFKPSPITAGMTAAGSPPAYGDVEA
ncbi:MAG: hypothetical protein JWQ95_4925 [Sphaerisporangium sp.]|nr:hypothetical protein [Sphaerisporangium sp.]